MGTIAPANAEIVSHVNVTYFIVDGNTPAEIYRNILDKGPRVNGDRALASIATRATQDGDLDEKDGTCRVAGYVIKLDVLIRRPRIANEQALSPEDRLLWQQFNDFITAHEDQHKSVWISCAADLDARITALRGPHCRDVMQQADALWEDMLASCDKLQRSFDEEQGLLLMQQPFMRRAAQAAP